MNQNMTFERMLATYMAEEASGRAPERLVDDVLSATSRTRPDPRWLALLKEPPMRTQTRVVVGMPARRLILAMAAAALLLLALLAAVVGANLLKPPQQLASDDWPMFRGDSTRAGLVLHGPKGRPVVQWQYKAQGAVTQNISIVGDTVYVPTDNGYVNAVALADGTLRWSIQLDRGPASGLIVADGLVLVRDGDGVFYGLDAAMGSRQWQSSGNAPGGANATIGPGALYVGAENGDLVAFDTKTGKERWRTAIGAGGGVNNAAYADGLVYVATQNAGFFAVDARTGAQRWRVDVGGDVTGTPVVANGIAYIGSGTDTSSGHLRAVDAKTGQSIWTLNEPIGSPSLANGIAYASAPNLGLEVAFDEKTGRELWRVKFPGGGTTRAPAIADGIVFVPQDGEHRIYALDATTGGEYWHFDLDSGNNCCIAVTKGSVFVGTDLGTVYRISGDGSTLTAGSVATVPPTARALHPPDHRRARSSGRPNYPITASTRTAACRSIPRGTSGFPITETAGSRSSPPTERSWSTGERQDMATASSSSIGPMATDMAVSPLLLMAATLCSTPATVACRNSTPIGRS
jgi:outer membrane protein assembly factor BamB